MINCGLCIFWLHRYIWYYENIYAHVILYKSHFASNWKKPAALARVKSFEPQATMVVNSVEGVQSNGKWHNNEIYIDCYQYFDDHDHTTNTTPYMAVNSRWLSELEFQVSFTMWQLCAEMMSWVGRWVELVVY